MQWTSSREAMESTTSSLVTTRVTKWQSTCRSHDHSVSIQAPAAVRPRRVSRIFDVKSLRAIETHDDLWELLEKRPGWVQQKIGGPGEVEYCLMTSTKRTLATAKLPSDLASASPSVLHDFVNKVNQFEHAHVLDVWQIYIKVREVEVSTPKPVETDTNHSSSSKPSADGFSHSASKKLYAA